MQCGIYCIKNQVNNKIYIGQSRNITKRWEMHKYELNNNVHHSIKLQNAWNLYGSDAFVFSILELCVPDELNEKEVSYISKFDSFNNGYNCTPGGDFSEYLSKRVICFDKNGNELSRYDSVIAAAADKNVQTSSVIECCQHKRKTAANCIWQYEEGFIEIPQYHFTSRHFTNVQQYDMDGNLINTYVSYADAARHTGVCDTSILRCCNGKLATAGGYIWKSV